MNHKGQSLVLFVCLLPLFIALLAFVFDSALIIRENNKLSNIASLALSYLVVEHRNDKEIEKIIELLLIQVEKRLSDNGYNINIDRNVIEEIKKQGYDKNYGARPLRRSIQTLVEDKIAEEILAGTLSVGKKQSYEFSKKQ